MQVSEIFRSVQGEGVRIGEPSLFLRTSQCNLSCGYCDTKQKIDHIEWEGSPLKLSEWINKELENRPVKTLVITGGEPTIWGEELIQLLEFINRDCNIGLINIQTNGELLSKFTQVEYPNIFWSISPKFLSSGKDNMIEKKKFMEAVRFLSERLGELKLVINEEDFIFIDEVVPILNEMETVVFQPAVCESINSAGDLSNMMNFQKYGQLYRKIFDRYSHLIHAKFLPQIHKFVDLK